MVMLGQPGETVGQGRDGGGWDVGGARGPGPVNGKSGRSALAPALSRLLIFFFPFGSHLRPTDRGHTAPCLPAHSKTHTHAHKHTHTHTHTHRTHTTPARHGPGAVGGGREARGGGRPCSPRRSQPRYPPPLLTPPLSPPSLVPSPPRPCPLASPSTTWRSSSTTAAANVRVERGWRERERGAETQRELSTTTTTTTTTPLSHSFCPSLSEPTHPSFFSLSSPLSPLPPPLSSQPGRDRGPVPPLPGPGPGAQGLPDG